jgi:adenylate kinase
VDGVCDVDGGKLEHRADDRADVIENRLNVYEKNTAPMKEYYQKDGRFVSVDGVGDPKVVVQRIEKVLAL